MCGRFSIADFEGIEERFQIEPPNLKPNYNVAHSQNVPVNDGVNHLALFKWGSPNDGGILATRSLINKKPLYSE